MKKLFLFSLTAFLLTKEAWAGCNNKCIIRNPISGKWGDDYSSLQRHISIAIAYNIWYYYQVTNDISFMEEGGAEMFFEICRFWASKCEKDNSTGRFSIAKVMVNSKTQRFF